jgi:hypothetical protein
MKLALWGLMAASALQALPLRLEPGEYRWVPFTVKRSPTAVDCRFRVLQGGPTVHMEILSAAEFRRFSRGRNYDPFASAPDGRTGEIRRLVDERGEFAVVVENDEHAPVAMVDLEVTTDLNPSPDSLARVLPPDRRLAVILISFGIFFGLVTWSGWRLWRGANAGRVRGR